MTAQDFYSRYGYPIHVFQGNSCAFPHWPHANPNRCPSDIPIDDRTIKGKFKCYGIVYWKNLRAVLYQPGYITYMVLPDKNCAAISYEFSGCYMAKLCFKGVWYVFHISTGVNLAEDCKLAWLDFLHFHKTDITGIAMFKPSSEPVFGVWGELRYRQRMPVTLACLIDNHNKGYSLVFNYTDCRVTDSDDRNIVSSHNVLLARDEDKLHFLRKTI